MNMFTGIVISLLILDRFRLSARISQLEVDIRCLKSSMNFDVDDYLADKESE